MIRPKHIAIIVDGNRRWAKKRGLPTIAGHKYVTDHTIEELMYHCLRLKIPYLTFWAFSTENWKRGKRFSQAIFGLLRRRMQINIDKYKKDGIRLNLIGDLSKLSKDLTKILKRWQEESRNNKKIMVTIALNYGGRDEMLRAINKVIKSKAAHHLRGGGIAANNGKEHLGGEITEKEFNKYLDTARMPDPDLIIRTGGEQRLSGFLLWQSEYSEFYFTDVLMPDFTTKEFDKALEEYSRRQRRFGK